MNVSSLPNLDLVSRKIFRAYDIRGNVNLLTPTLVGKIADVLAQDYLALGQAKVVVGYDARLSSAEYAKVMSQRLTHAGLKVIDIGCVSSPLLYFTALSYAAGNGVMITASHNPVSDNGIKWISKGLPPSPQAIQQVADCILQQPCAVVEPVVYMPDCIDALDAYIQFLSQDIHLKETYRISLDGLHGSAGEIAQKALLAMGCQVDALNCQANGHFPLGAPDPSDPQRLNDLRQSVLSHDAAMGVALDGDGDRVVILDECGRYVSPDRLMCLFAKICLLQQPQAEIISDVKCSTMIAQTVLHYAGRYRMIRTGSSFLRNDLYQSHAVFGGEFAGHYVFNDGRGKGYDDGLYAALRLLEYLDQTKQSLSQALAEFPERIATRDVYIDSLGIDYQEIAQCIENRLVQDQVRLSKIDGIRLDFPFGFGIIRPSNTGEYFTLRFDADNPEHLEQIRYTFISLLQQSFPQIADAVAVAN